MREECFPSPPGVPSSSAIFRSILARDEDVAKATWERCRGSPPTGKDCRACTAEIQLQKLASLCVYNMGTTTSKNIPFENIARGSILIKDYQFFF